MQLLYFVEENTQEEPFASACRAQIKGWHSNRDHDDVAAETSSSFSPPPLQ